MVVAWEEDDTGGGGDFAYTDPNTGDIFVRVHWHKKINTGLKAHGYLYC